MNSYRRSLMSCVVFALMACLPAPAHGDTITLEGFNSGQFSTATAVLEFNSQTNTMTFTLTNTSHITQTGSTSTLTSIGFDLAPLGNASASGLNGFTGQQAPSLSSTFTFSDAALGSVPDFNTAVLDFGFLTVLGGAFSDGNVSLGLLPGESASFTVSGAAFTGFTEEQILNALFVGFMTVPTQAGGGGFDVAAASATATPVPEPATALLIGVGLAAMAGRALRRKPR